MAEKKSFYENVYTKQVEELVSNQKTYDNKKEEAKAKAKAESVRKKNLLRVLYLILGLLFVIGAYRLNELDTSNGPIITGFLVIAVALFYFVRWINK